jgi:hypothetical protein
MARHQKVETLDHENSEPRGLLREMDIKLGIRPGLITSSSTSVIIASKPAGRKLSVSTHTPYEQRNQRLRRLALGLIACSSTGFQAISLSKLHKATYKAEPINARGDTLKDLQERPSHPAGPLLNIKLEDLKMNVQAGWPIIRNKHHV